MNRTEKKTERTLKGVAIGLLCLFLLLSGFLFLKLGQENDSMEQNACAEDTYAPPPQTSEETVAFDDTVPSGDDDVSDTDAPETEPETQATSATEAPAVNYPVQDDTDEPSPTKPTAPEPDQDETDTTRPSAPEQNKEDKPSPTEPQETEPTPTEPEATEPEPTEPEKNIIQVLGQVTAENNVVTQEATFGESGVSASVPAGVVVNEGTTELVLTIEEKDSSDSGVALENGQAILPLDVHMEGVSQSNTQPIQVCLGKILPGGMNIGNVTLYHVENGTANPMTQVLTAAELDTHNEFYYDPATGDTTVMMASFSEVAVVSENAAWEGVIAAAFNSGSGTADDPYIIANADQLAYMSKAVSNDEAYASAHYKLVSNVDLSGDKARADDDKALVFYPIGYWAEQEGSNGYDEKWYGAGNSFTGTFDGNGNTISNIYQNTWLMDGNYDAGYWRTAMGLFGALYNATIKNLTIDNFQSDGEFTPTGCIAAYAGGPNMLFENISLTNCNPRVYNTGNGGLVGLNYNSSSEGSYDNIVFRNVTVDQTNKISALWGSYDVSCGGILGRLRENSKHDGTNTDGQKNTVTFENCHVAAIMDVNNDVCANYQYYQYRYSGMFIGTVDYIGDVPNVGLEDVVFASNSTFTYGDWNEYWYCELVKNSLASYTHDHQFSRLTKISDISEIQDADGNWNTEGNFVLPNEDNTSAVCYHIFKNSEDTLYQHFHNVEDESNPDIYETKDINADGELNDLKEDRTCYFIPFGQLWTGYGWGSSPSYDATNYANIGITLREDGLVKAEEKFTATEITSVSADVPVKLSELFTLAADESKLSKSTLSVFVSPVITESTTSTVTAKVDIDSSEWGNSTLTFSGTGAAKIVITDYFYCTPTEIIVTVAEPASVDKFNLVFENTDEYLYRVGNANTVSLVSLFKAIDGAKIGNVDVTVTSLNEDIDVSGTYTANTSDWTQGTIQFSGTGPVLVTIDDDAYANEKTLMLEVVDATNVTAYSGLGNKNSVLLNDITMSTGSSYYLSNATLYGNGFTFDVTAGAYASGDNISSNYLIYLSNAALDNVEIVGAVYTSYGATAKDDYNRPVVLSVGSNTITNCYISNCAAPVRVKDGNLEIVNSTLKGGNFANIDIRGGHVILDNVTTINQVNGNDTATDGTIVVGLGVVIYYEQVLETTTVEIRNGITQYNHLSESQAETYISDSTASTLVSKMFDSTYSAVQYNDGTEVWVNTGILSMTEAVGDNNISDVDGFAEATPTFQGTEGYLHTKQPDATSIAEKAPEYVTAGQGAIAPSYSFDYTTKNYVAKADGSNDYCYEDGGTVLISMDVGDSYDWDTSILTATKNGQALDYTVSMNGTDYTGKSITFNTAGNYTVTYTYTDNNNYSVNESGNITTYGKTYTKSVHINVVVVAPEAKNAVFTFGSSGTASTTTTIGNNTYVMPNVSATSSTVGSITVSGTTVYYPIVDAYTSDGETAHSSLNSWYMCFPVFKNVVTITDYADGGLGAEDVHDSSETEMPSGLSLTAYSDYLTSLPTGAVSFTTGGADEAFKYQASSSASSTPKALDSVLIYASPTLSNNARNELYLLVQYKYQDNAGATYYYYVGYHMPETTEKTICVTGDTLVTLSDGSQKRVDEVTYSDEMLVWNFFTGEYDVASAAILFYHGDDLYEVLNLTFDDGTVVKVINNHGFFDVNSNNWVFIDKENAESYIGHDFVKTGTDGYETVKLIGYSVTEEYTGSYSIQTAQHNNFMVEGMFSITMPEYEGWFDYFEIGENMKYDEEKMQADIEQYGLYTYEDFADYVTYEQFIAFNGPYLKVLVGRGVVTYEQILDLIEAYVTPLQ